YQPKEIFPVHGVPEVRQHAFWVAVDKKYCAPSKQLESQDAAAVFTNLAVENAVEVVVRFISLLSDAASEARNLSSYRKPCIFPLAANEILEKVASFGLHANMIVYLTKTYHMSPAAGAIVLFIWGAASNFTPVFGAFVSDSCLGRFRVIAIGSFVSLIVSPSSPLPRTKQH
ncbi:hypothetical protein GW17_00061129, partial [Ensete ventricosum]